MKDDLRFAACMLLLYTHEKLIGKGKIFKYPEKPDPSVASLFLHNYDIHAWTYPVDSEFDCCTCASTKQAPVVPRDKTGILQL